MSDEATPSIFRIFYAWQSDHDPSTNRRFIGRALEVATADIVKAGKHPALRPAVDEATRGEPGSPNIPLTILTKIQGSDMFVCDVSTVNHQSTNPRFRGPNQNVLFELGFAVAVLGWSRVVLLFNESYGTLPDDLPFDFDRHRVISYNAGPAADGDEAAKKQLLQANSSLAGQCRVAIENIIVSNPSRPNWALAESPESVRRARDVNLLRFLLSQIHFPTLELHVEGLPQRVSQDIFYFWSGCAAIWSASTTYVHDEHLRKLVDDLLRTWNATISHGQNYMPAPRGDFYSFQMAICGFRHQQDEKDWETIESEARSLAIAIYAFTQHIHENYLEIDLSATSQEAWATYVRHNKELDEHYMPKTKKQAKARPTST